VNAHRPHPSGSGDPLGMVAGTAAQEIGSALTAIQVAAERLERVFPGGSGEGSPELLVIRDQSQRLARLARHLLDLARPGARAPIEVPLGGEVRRLLAAIERVLAREDVALYREGFAVAGTGPGPLVRADPARIQEVFLALLANARKAVAGGEAPGWVRVGVRDLPDGGGEVVVSDSGPGVPPGAEERIFLPFVSGWGGEGMGLSRSRLSLAREGGGLRLRRSECGAAEFVLTLEPYLKTAE